jgi:hypothetical protein
MIPKFKVFSLERSKFIDMTDYELVIRNMNTDISYDIIECVPHMVLDELRISIADNTNSVLLPYIGKSDLNGEEICLDDILIYHNVPDIKWLIVIDHNDLSYKMKLISDNIDKYQVLVPIEHNKMKIIGNKRINKDLISSI